MVAVTCLMLLVMNQTMKIREHTWTPVTITDVLTIPTANQERRTLKAAKVPPQNQRRLINWTHGEWSSLTNGTMSHLEDKTDRYQFILLFFLT